MKEEVLQQALVTRAEHKAQDLLKDFCLSTYSSKDYYNYLKTNLDNKVIEIPNIQLWVEDHFLTNSTTLNILDIAAAPYSYAQQPMHYHVPKDNKNFKEGDMHQVQDAIFYDRYIAELLTVFKTLESFYPTHTVEVHDFSLAMYTLWRRFKYTLLKDIQQHYTKFFTHGLMNIFLSTLLYPLGGYRPNIKLIIYDAIGLETQCALRKKLAFGNRFKSKNQFLAICTDEAYEEFIEELIMPFRSKKATTKNFRWWNIHIREVEDFPAKPFKAIQGLMEGQVISMNKSLYTAFEMLTKEVPVEEVMAMLEGEVDKATYNKINRCIAKFKRQKSFIHHEFLEKNVGFMKERGITFSKYKYTMDLTPPRNILSEVIINMDEFRLQYPSCTEQQFTEVFLFANTINTCKRKMKSSFKRREAWNLCTKIVKGDQNFEFEELAKQLTEQLRSEQMDNFILRIV